jgi:DNA-directed RNA polymerase specialized sigma24 family protein
VERAGQPARAATCRAGLRYWEGLDAAETAEALSCAAGTVKSQTSDAIAALRRLLPGYVSETLERR